MEDVADDEDDDFAWQTPKKKRKSTTGKGKSTRSKAGGSARNKAAGSTRSKKKTGKTKRSAGSSAANPKAGSTRSSSMKRSGKRKKATSARRSSRDDDDDELGNSSGRRRRAPPPKKKGVDPVIPISIVTGALLLCGGIVFIRSRKSNVEVRDEEKMLKEADALFKKGRKAFSEWNKARQTGPISLEMAKHKEALGLLEKANAKMEEALQPYRDKNTGFLKKEYQGYEDTLQEIGKLRYDLVKSARTGG